MHLETNFEVSFQNANLALRSFLASSFKAKWLYLKYFIFTRLNYF